MKVVSAGRICMDIFIDKKKRVPGGESLNFCGNICGFNNIECYIMGIIGNDDYGKAIFEKINKCSIDTRFLKIKEGVTANNKVYHDKNGDRFFLADSWTEGIHKDFYLDDNELQFLKCVDVVHTTIDSPVFQQIIECKKYNSFSLAVDFNVHRDFDKIELMNNYVDLFFISGSEEIFDKLIMWSLKYNTIFICTLGENGSVAFEKGNKYRCDALEVEEVLDTTGAGDSFQAGFIASYYLHNDIYMALKCGSECAARNIIKIGGF